MGWEDLIDALEELQSEREYDGYFCSIKDAVIIVILGSLCDLKSVKKMDMFDNFVVKHVAEF